jgi:hypothetical protein
MPRVVVNACHGGFGLSHDAVMRYSELAGLNLRPVKNEQLSFVTNYYIDGVIDDDNLWVDFDLDRTDPLLVQVVEELGELASGQYSKLRIADVPEGVKWFIDDYDGVETIHEEHRSW